MNTLKEIYEKNKEQALEEFFTFLRFQSISSESDKNEETKACAEWVKEYVEKIGFKAEIWDTVSHPVIFASHLDAGPDKPTLLIYNHYDVQPVDPLEEWESPPFEPAVRDGEVYARGAQDNKGQCFYVLQALKILKERDGSFPVNLKLIIEGDEEVGSAGLSSILKTKKEALKADYLAVVDLGMKNLSTPAITLGVRGIITFDVEAKGSAYDLHSGFMGGVVFNPIHGLVDVFSKVRNQNGKITIPGFYDGIEEIEGKESLSFDFDEKEFKEMFDALPTGGERELPPLERAWLRPTFEINGIHGGYTGSGFKTVIPAKAHAKISCRLVPGQNSEKIKKSVVDFLEKNAPEGITIKVHPHKGAGEACRSEISSPIVKAFSKGYEEVFGKPCEYIFEGGSIPISTELSQASESEVIFVGLGLPDDKIHAPNEHFGVDRLEKGALVMARTIEALDRFHR